MEGNHISLPKIKLGKFLKRHFTYASLLVSVVTELEKIPHLNELKMNKEVTTLVCNIIEQVKLKKKSTKITIDKRTFVLEVLHKIFPDLTDDEHVRLSEDIDFICENGLHLKKRTLMSCLFGLVDDFFF